MPRTVIVGDIHGMLPELCTLVEKVGLTKTDILVSVGDLLDKGPDSPGVVRYLRGLREAGFQVVFTIGNHEEKHFRFRRHLAADPVRAMKMKKAEEMLVITHTLSPEDIAFLETGLPIYQGDGFVVVHAGVLPDMTRIPTEDEFWTMSKREREKWDRTLRVRHVRGEDLHIYDVRFESSFPPDKQDIVGETFQCHALVQGTLMSHKVRPKGEFISLGEESPGDPFWADIYDNRFGHVYFGHSPFPDAPEPIRYYHATGLDLGCCFGGHLAAVVLEPGKGPSFVMVKASGKFAQGYWEE